MKHAKHSKPLRAARIALALLAALAASTAAGQAQPGKGAPASAGPAYGPVLHGQPATPEPGARRHEPTPQAQEEQAGAHPAGGAPDIDPSARPAPQPQQPAARAPGKEQGKDARRSARRSPPQRVEAVAVAMPGPPLLAAPPPPQPMPLRPGPARIDNCPGGVCTDTGGATYNTGVGNAAVDGAGRLCTRSGDTIQCF